MNHHFPARATAAGQDFHLRTSAVEPDSPQMILVAADRALSDDDVERFAQIVGYAHKVTIRAGGSLPDPERDTESSFVMRLSVHGSRRTRPAEALLEFEASLSQMVTEGTPVRRTDKAGPGTAGTRLVDGFGDVGFVLYYDAVRPALGRAA